ncbi:hypothetical protein [Paracoccus haeundaensis]|uniref:Potassium channel domain-containing protein n=1 Tax=Paracoccus haeundaensis TaxID=225362 RepID=A0A5C4R2B1_9RHOB|nr:hypothetical protein [Paracoccus haeundaensis]TNH38100.1 hypothetical protein FHD67_16800 [Paracoccus haeundaensis]
MLIFTGVALVLIVFYDFLRTTISLSGTRFISRAIADGLWRLGSKSTLVLEQTVGLSIRGLLGLVILLTVAGTWVLLHLCGYVLILRGGLSLVQTDTGDPATWVQTVAFAGSTLSTLGASTVQVTGGWWDILSMVAAMNGMILLTLAVSFILNILQTTNSARTFACRFHAVKAGAPDGHVSKHLEGLGSDLTTVVVMLTASPLPRFFVPSDPTMDFPRALIEICDLVENGTLVDTSEVVAAIRLLGRHLGTLSDHYEIAAARKWALRHTIPRFNKDDI